MPFAMPLHSLPMDRAVLLSTSAASDRYLHYLTGQPQPLQRAVKRLFEIIASLTALALLAPLLLCVALLIKLTSPGPILFKQDRVGLHGSHFRLLKFRSMGADADKLKAALCCHNEQSGPVFKMKMDPRVTFIGRFIRRYSIDELPQLVNILRGDMAIVGPRPALPEEVSQYKAWQRRRFSMRPGLTCYWQVSGRNQIGFEDWMRLDLEYVDNWNLRTDISLIVRTVPIVLTGRGAS
jgi:exopolysaccharide biosynthesis polyprenyl glycosylphosphotransferase